MFKLINIKASSKIGKKFFATFENKETKQQKIIHFGATGYRDYTLINDKKSKYYIADRDERDKVKSLYQKRHAKDLETKQAKTGMSPGALSYYILWTEPTLKRGIQNYRNKFNL